MQKRIIIALIVLINVFMLTGCWNYIEIDQQMNVAAVAIDVGEGGKKYHLSAEVVSVGMDENGGVKVTVVETDADTIFEGVRNLMTVTTKKLYFGHCKAIVIGEEAAKNGIAEMLDLTVRNHETRAEVNILIAKGCDGKDILKTEGVAVPIMGYKIFDLVKTSTKFVGEAPNINAHIIFNSIQMEGHCTVIPLLEITQVDDKSMLKLAGAGVFEEDRLIYCLDNLQTRNLSILLNKLNSGGLLTYETAPGSGSYISYEIYKNKAKTKLDFCEDGPIVNILVNTSVIIGEVQTESDFTKPEEVEKYRQHVKENLKEDLLGIINTAQKKQCDFIGIGVRMQKDYPEIWELYKDNWDEEFGKIKFNVDCKVKITGSGIINKSADNN